MTGASLKAFRERRGESQAAFAVSVGLSKRALGRYEIGAVPVPHIVALACAALSAGVSPMS